MYAVRFVIRFAWKTAGELTENCTTSIVTSLVVACICDNRDMRGTGEQVCLTSIGCVCALGCVMLSSGEIESTSLERR